MTTLGNKHSNWSNGSNHILPTLPNTNTNNNTNSPTISNYGYVPIKSIEYHHYIGINGQSVKLPNLWSTYG